MKTDVANPVIRKIKDNEVAMTEFEKELDVKQKKKIVYDSSKKKYSKVTMRKTLSDGSKQNFC